MHVLLLTLQMALSYQIAWRRDSRSAGYCNDDRISDGSPTGEVQLNCSVGCAGPMEGTRYRCTAYSSVDNWELVHGSSQHTFQSNATHVEIIYNRGIWFHPYAAPVYLFARNNILIRNDTGRINSTPRSITSPVIRIQANCTHTIQIPVVDPDGDRTRCRWAQGASECGQICDAFPYATLERDTCTVRYHANHGVGYKIASIVIQDFKGDVSTPLSSVSLQFLVFVFSAGEACERMPRFINPTPPSEACVTVPLHGRLHLLLRAFSGDRDLHVKAIDTAAAFPLQKSAIQRRLGSSIYQVKVQWEPTADQSNQTYPLCYTVINTVGLSSEQTCIYVLVGSTTPVPIDSSLSPQSGASVVASGSTWSVQFDQAITFSSTGGRILFKTTDTDSRVVYSISPLETQEATVVYNDTLIIEPRFRFPEGQAFYIVLEAGVVSATNGCRPDNEPRTNASFWQFDVRDQTPPLVTLLQSPRFVRSRINVRWTVNEEAHTECQLDSGRFELCDSEAWSHSNLTDGDHTLIIRSTDSANNTVVLPVGFTADVTPPIVTLTHVPPLVSNQSEFTFVFRCSERFCSLRCHLSKYCSNMTSPENDYDQCTRGYYRVRGLESGHHYKLTVKAMDVVGNVGTQVTHRWSVDLDSPVFSEVLDITVPCEGPITPQLTGVPNVTDNLDGTVTPTYTDVVDPCVITRTWRATDDAGNTATLSQAITRHFEPKINALDDIAAVCDSREKVVTVPDETATAPNPCNRPLWFTQIQANHAAVSCPCDIERIWKLRDMCSSVSATKSQTIHLLDKSRGSGCGTGLDHSRGICFQGHTQCRTPWIGSDCSIHRDPPELRQPDDVTLLEGEAYTQKLELLRGTAPVRWTIKCAPASALLNMDSENVMTVRIMQPVVGQYKLCMEVESQAGQHSVIWFVHVRARYEVEISPVNPSVYAQGTATQIAGFIRHNPHREHNNATSVCGYPVIVDVLHVDSGLSRSLKAFSDRSNNFSVNFTAPEAEYGRYAATARHPSAGRPASHTVYWDVVRLTVSPRPIVLDEEILGAYFIERYVNLATITNDGSLDLSNFTVEKYEDSDITINLNLNGTNVIPIFEMDTVLFLGGEISCLVPCYLTISVPFTAGDGLHFQLPLALTVEQIPSPLRISPPQMHVALRKGTSRRIKFDITNLIKSKIEDVSLSYDRHLLRLLDIGTGLTPNSTLSLDPESTASAVFTVDSSLARHGSFRHIISTVINISTSEYFAQADLMIAMVPDSTLNLTVLVRDEVTYCGTRNPSVTDAQVIILQGNDISLRKSTSEGNGSATFYDLQEGYYDVLVKSPRHHDVNTVVHASVEHPVHTVFLPRQVVSCTWQAKPARLGKTPELKLTSSFHMQTPVPAIVVTPTELDLTEVKDWNLTSFQLNITNHGVVASQSLDIQLPHDHPLFEFRTIQNHLGDLPARSSILVPIVVKLRRHGPRDRKKPFYTNCTHDTIVISYGFQCEVWHRRHIPIPLKVSEKSAQEMLTVINDASMATCINSVEKASLYDSEMGFASEVRSALYCDTLIQDFVKCNPSLLLPEILCIPPTITSPADIIATLDWIACNISANLDISNIDIPSSYLSSSCNGGLFGCEEDLCGTYLREHLSRTESESGIAYKVAVFLTSLCVEQLNIKFATELLGTQQWVGAVKADFVDYVIKPVFDDLSDMGHYVSEAEFQKILDGGPKEISAVHLQHLVLRFNNTLGNWTIGMLDPPTPSTDFASHSNLSDIWNKLHNYQTVLGSYGFSDYVTAHRILRHELDIIFHQGEPEVCVAATMKVEKRVVEQGESFSVTFQLDNLNSGKMNNVSFKMKIWKPTAPDHGDSQPFILSEPLFYGLLNGHGELKHNESGSLVVKVVSKVVPSSVEAVYNIGGTLEYTLEGEQHSTTVDVHPVSITVHRRPSFVCHIFLGVNGGLDRNTTNMASPRTIALAVENTGTVQMVDLRLLGAYVNITNPGSDFQTHFDTSGLAMGTEGEHNGLFAVNYSVVYPHDVKISQWRLKVTSDAYINDFTPTFSRWSPFKGGPTLIIPEATHQHDLVHVVTLNGGFNGHTGSSVGFLVRSRLFAARGQLLAYASTTLNSYNVSSTDIIQARLVNSNATHVTFHVTPDVRESGWVLLQINMPCVYAHSKDMEKASLVVWRVHANKLVFILPEANMWISQISGDFSLLNIFDNFSQDLTVMYVLQYSFKYRKSGCGAFSSFGMSTPEFPTSDSLPKKESGQVHTASSTANSPRIMTVGITLLTVSFCTLTCLKVL